jgi:S-adenosylmethionine/arginine decarboxylase-like enzyme
MYDAPPRHISAVVTRPFGRLLMLDVYDCREGVCEDLALCHAFLEAEVSLLRTTVEVPPIVFKNAAKGGVTGWAALLDASIAIHTFTPKNFVSVDVFACSDVASDDVEDLAHAYFHPQQIEVNCIDRGHHKD